VYSFGDQTIGDCDPNILGEKVLSIWNERVSAIRKRYNHLRTVVLLKSDDLLELAVFELETVMFPERDFTWQWNKRKNLEGLHKTTNEHKFTWQPHGSQFTIIETVPDNRLALRIKQPPYLDREDVLKALKFDESWIEIVK